MPAGRQCPFFWRGYPVQMHARTHARKHAHAHAHARASKKCQKTRIFHGAQHLHTSHVSQEPDTHTHSTHTHTRTALSLSLTHITLTQTCRPLRRRQVCTHIITSCFYISYDIQRYYVLIHKPTRRSGSKFARRAPRVCVCVCVCVCVLLPSGSKLARRAAHTTV